MSNQPISEIDPEWGVGVLANFISDNRRQVIERSLANRTRYVTVVLEDAYQPHNAAAVMRTCECYGVQDVHVIESQHKFKPASRVVAGARQWMTIHRYSAREHARPTAACQSTLRERGYRIVALSPRPEAAPIRNLSLASPVALFIGCEKPGLSEEAIAEADELAHLPLYGFTESFNLSVAAALALESLVPRLHRSHHVWRLTAQERTQLKFDWYRSSVRAADRILQRAATDHPRG